MDGNELIHRYISIYIEEKHKKRGRDSLRQAVRKRGRAKQKQRSERMKEQKILVVDDEARMRKLVRDFLVRSGYLVVEAEDGEKALDISLIILDVMMPGLDGYQVLEEIRKYSKVPIIMLTARSDERDELRGFDLGVDEYVTKPFSPKTLVARVGAILRRTGADGGEEKLEMAGITMDLSAHAVYADGKEIDLSSKYPC